MSDQPATLTAIMVAPNGARLTRADHPALPITISETVSAVVEAAAAGADAVHLHVRDPAHQHVLDAGLYREAIQALKSAIDAEFPIQVTTESVGRYSPAQQSALVRELKPEFVSIALRELCASEAEFAAARSLYHWTEEQGTGVQHILYSVADLEWFLELRARQVIPRSHRSILFVLGRYTDGQQSDQRMLDPFLARMRQADGEPLHWMVCAFGVQETRCLHYAANQGGHVRVGFENSRWNDDGSQARSNAERVSELVRWLGGQRQRADCATLSRVLGKN